MGERLKMCTIKKQHSPDIQFINNYFRVEVLPIKRGHGFYSLSCCGEALLSRTL